MGGVLRQVDAVSRTHFLQLVLPVKIQNRAPGIAFDRLRSATLSVDIARQRGGAKQILFASEQKLGFVGASSHRVRVWRGGFGGHIPGCQHALNRIVLPEEERGGIGLQGPALVIQTGLGFRRLNLT
jgi:hypothetical protein